MIFIYVALTYSKSNYYYNCKSYIIKLSINSFFSLGFIYFGIGCEKGKTPDGAPNYIQLLSDEFSRTKIKGFEPIWGSWLKRQARVS